MEEELADDLDNVKLRNREITPPETPRQQQTQDFEKKFKLDLCARIAIKTNHFIGAKD